MWLILLNWDYIYNLRTDVYCCRNGFLVLVSLGVVMHIGNLLFHFCVWTLHLSGTLKEVLMYSPCFAGLLCLLSFFLFFYSSLFNIIYSYIGFGMSLGGLVLMVWPIVSRSPVTRRSYIGCVLSIFVFILYIGVLASLHLKSPCPFSSDENNSTFKGRL